MTKRAKTRVLQLCPWGLALAQVCTGLIGSSRDGDGSRENGTNAGDGGGAGNSGSGGGAGNAGAAGDGDTLGPGPGSATGPRFTCGDPATRGQGQLEMRRLTRDELMSSLAAVLGDDVMGKGNVASAASQIPAEAPGDRVATFQNGHAFDHVSGMLLTAQAVAAEVASDTSARERVLGACAPEADRACAERFLDTTALPLMRRPLAAARRAALLAAFESEGAGLAGMQWLLARTLQSPEALFHLELPRQRCEAAAGEDLTFAWDDESVFFSPLAGGGEVEPPAELTENGWFVWQVPGARVPGSYAKLRIALTARADDATPLELDVNLNDGPLLTGSRSRPVLGRSKRRYDRDRRQREGRRAIQERSRWAHARARVADLGADASAVSCADEPANGALYRVRVVGRVAARIRDHRPRPRCCATR